MPPMTSAPTAHCPPFTAWQPWGDYAKIPQIQRPGIYAVAISETDLSGLPFSIRPEIRYFGMTLSQGGLAGRLSQFHRALFGHDGPHGGAWRFRFDYPNAKHAIDHFFVSVARFDCDPTRKRASDLRIMGEVLALEYVCFADYFEVAGHLPKYNDPKMRSPKYFGIGPNLSFKCDSYDNPSGFR